MKSKLTLSLPEKTILEAKRIAKQRNTTVSALFSESLQFWHVSDASSFTDPEFSGRGLEDLIGVLSAKPAFDEKSARIREKHG